MRYLTSVRRVLAVPAATLLLVSAAVAQFTGSVDFTSKQQSIDGFGVAATFNRPAYIQMAAGNVSSQIVDQLFNPITGVGITMLRMGMDDIVPNTPVGSGIQIVTTPPVSCSVTPSYSGWDGSAGGEVWLGQQAVKYGVNRFYANSWSAPAYMKTNNTIQSGGAICGGPNATTQAQCTKMGDCRGAYANYMMQFIKLFQSSGVPISDFDWINEPTENVSYASMTMSTAQVVDFLHVIGPVVQSSGINVKMNCCDSPVWTGSTGAVGYTNAVLADPVAASFITAYTGHEYGGPAVTPLPANGQNTWMSEWGPQSPAAYNTSWDQMQSGTSPNSNNGMYVANDISNNLSKAGVSAYIWWYADSTGATGGMIQIGATSGATSYVVTKRLFALGHFARFVRPGANRVTMSTNNTNLNVTAFVNPDGSKVINVVNNDHTTDTLSLALDATTANWVPTSYFSDENDSIAPTNAATVSGNTLSASFAPRSLTSIVLAPPVIEGSVQLVVTRTLQAQGDGSYLASLKVSNLGSGTAQNVELNGCTLGTAVGSTLPIAALPYSIGNIAPGSFALVTVNYPAGQTAGSMVMERYTGTYSGGSFGSSIRAVLPALPTQP